MEKQNLITSPSVNFNCVEELLLCDKLNTEEKIVALENWKATWLLELSSSDEGMTECDHSLYECGASVEDISDALRCLKSAS
ncbi:MAG: hypothetical protein M9899_00145 [Bdellovibrionaceae bacterium]|nr:hypothetical protein [Pseudobdellovibrionaceae bacterium]